MAKANKSLDFQKKKRQGVEANSTNGKLKTKTGLVQNKKHKNKKNKQIQSDNGAIKTKKDKKQSSKEIIESVGQETSTVSPKRVVVDKTVATEILSNPTISKKKSKKKIAKTPTESLSTIKSKQKKVVSEVVGDGENTVQDDDGEETNTVSPTVGADDFLVTDISKKQKKKLKKKVAQTSVESLPSNKTKKRKAVKEEGGDDELSGQEEADAVEEKKPKLDKKRKKSKTSGAGVEMQKNVENDPESKGDATTKDKPLVSVFVGNLPINTKRGKILKLFSKFGKVKSIRFRLSNGGKFFKSQSKVTSPNVIAFVDFESMDDAKSSLVLNGEKIKDNVIRVNLQSIAKSNENFDGKRTVFVGNLKYSVTDQNLHDLFSCCGGIEYARTMQCEKGCNGIGYVCFKKTESVSMALELANSDLQGRPVRVQRYVKKAPGGPNEKKMKKEKPIGAARRIDKKHKVKSFSKDKEQKPNKQFAGMKAKDKKKKTFNKKTKPLKGPKLLAKKIASREKPPKTA